jgi:hypothetical protein
MRQAGDDEGMEAKSAECVRDRVHRRIDGRGSIETLDEVQRLLAVVLRRDHGFPFFLFDVARDALTSEVFA